MSKGKISLKILFALSTFLGVIFLVRATSKPVEARPMPKAYVCKYVGTPGINESLQTGQNPIEVNGNAISGWNGSTIPFWFNDSQGRSVAIGIVGDDPEPSVENCPTPPEPRYAVDVYSPQVVCGTQDIVFSGAAKYERNTDHLVVLLDGNMIYQSQSEPTSWSTSPVSVGVGTHTVEARVYDEPNDQNTHSLNEFKKLGASDSEEFTIRECEQKPLKLKLTFMQPCEPAEGTPENAQWRIRNSNDYSVEYEVQKAGDGIIKSGSAEPGDSFFYTPWGAQTLILKALGMQDTKAGGDSYNGTQCPTICEITSWTCQQCQIAPCGEDGSCEDAKYKYCNKYYGCDWVAQAQEKGLILDDLVSISKKEWVCDNTCETDPVNSISVHGGDAACTNSFPVRAHVEEDGSPVEGVEVTFEYKTEQKKATTNADGDASVSFGWGGVYEVRAYASGYGLATLNPSHRNDCEGEESDEGEVLGLSTETTGSVLGASTMADTGVANDLIGIVFTAGSLLTTFGLMPYKSKKD